MVVKHVDLRPDRDLLHSNFDGYKLSLDPVPVLRDEHKSHQVGPDPTVRMTHCTHQSLLPDP